MPTQRRARGSKPEPTMTAAEFKVMREQLGLPAAWVAQKLNTREKSVSRWESGVYPVNAAAEKLLRDVAAETDAIVNEMVQRMVLRTDAVTLSTYRRDAAAAFPVGDHGPYPASWHRAMIGRVAAEVGKRVRIVYADDGGDDTAIP